MIYVTGDVHGYIFERFNPQMMPGEDAWTENDKLIVLGDFGLIFYPRMELFLGTQIVLEQRKLAYLESKPYEILFVDGNHENFDRLTAEFPTEERYGGTVSRLGRNVFWLRRGQIYTIEGKTFFCMGGAYSVDKFGRREGVSWWPQELPADAEYRFAADNLVAHGRSVDYVLTHTCPRVVIGLMHHAPDVHEMELTGFFDWIWYEIGFKKWYFGHWHVDEAVHPKATALYMDVLPVEAADN